MNTLEHPLAARLAIAKQLENKLHALHMRHRAFFGGITVSDERVSKVAGTYATTMTQGYTLGFDGSKELLILSLFPERFGTDFWGTPVGRALAWLGSASDTDSPASETSSEAVPQGGAALALGVVKQRTSQMVREGKLDRHWDGSGVTRASLAVHMQERWPAP